MREIIWLPTAQKHLNLIYEWLSERSESVAYKLIQDILSAVGKLSEFPFIAQREEVLKGFDKEFRSLIVRKHFKIIYFIESDKIIVVAVWDCRQDSQKIKSEIIK